MPIGVKNPTMLVCPVIGGTEHCGFHVRGLLSGSVDEPIVWENLVNAALNGNGDLDKNIVGNGYNSGAQSTKSVASGDCSVYYLYNNLIGNNNMLGLSNGNTNDDWTDIDFAIGWFSGKFRLYENGVLRHAETTVSPNDSVGKVAVESSEVVIYLNDVEKFRYSPTITYPLIVDSALYARFFPLVDVMIEGGWS